MEDIENVASVVHLLSRFSLEQKIYKSSDFVYGRTIGVGSFSQIVRCVCKATDRIYALKIVDKSVIVREGKVKLAKLERHILSALEHPGVVRLYFSFQDSNSLYYGLEYCEGGDLFDLVEKNGPLNVEIVKFIAAQLVLTLEYIHKVGVIHRDLKPENVVLTLKGHVKLVDFGSAKLKLAGTPDEEDEETDVVGSPDYVSPEVLIEKEATKSCDLWALGCVIFFLLAGHPPFRAKTEYLTFLNIENRNFSFPQDFDGKAKDLVDQLLILCPEKRLGNNDINALKGHPFFEGINCNVTLFEGEGPKELEKMISQSISNVSVENDLYA